MIDCLQEIAYVIMDESAEALKLNYGRIQAMDTTTNEVQVETYIYTSLDQETGLAIVTTLVDPEPSKIKVGRIASHIKRMPFFESSVFQTADAHKKLVVLQDPVVLIYWLIFWFDLFDGKVNSHNP